MPSVKVPVLSEHITVILPKFSIELRRFTMTFFLAICFAPLAKLTLIIAGNNWGVNPTAKANVKSKESKKGLFKSTLTAKRKITMIKVISIKRAPNRLIPISKSVNGILELNFSLIFPNSVFFPVEIIKTVPVPLTTWEPIKTELILLFKGVSLSKTPIFFSTGKVSPVNVASSIKSSSSSIIRPSAGIISPALKKTISPITTSSTNISSFFSSLRTVVLTLIRFKSSFTASPADFSCQNPKIVENNIISSIIIELVVSCRKKERNAAKSNIRVIGFLNWFINNKKSDWVFLSFFKVLGPNLSNL